MTDGADIQTDDKTASAAASAAKAILPPEIQDSGRNAVFAALVKGDEDITGLVAYSVFKQNELDWLAAFRESKGREPTEAEAEAYIIGESTQRRLATYRHLADATLAGNGPDVANGGSVTGRALAVRQDSKSGGLGGSTIAYVVIALAVLVAVYFAARYGVAK